MKLFHFLVLIAAGLALSLSPVAAQWLDYPTAGIPRTPDGKPNLSAPAPKMPDGKPDLSGIWVAADNRHLADLADGADVPMLPWATVLSKERTENLGKGHPSERCLTHGVTDFDTLGIGWKIVQAPNVIAILYEAYNHYRQILMDGRPLPWGGSLVLNYIPDTELIEYICENEKDLPHMVGK